MEDEDSKMDATEGQSETDHQSQQGEAENEEYGRSTTKSNLVQGLNISGFLRTWAEVSRINYTSMMQIHASMSSKRYSQSLRHKSIGYMQDSSEWCCLSDVCSHDSLVTIPEQFPLYVTPLMNEDQHWGCFYVFPVLYADAYSPVVKILCSNDVTPIVDGVLTRDIVATGLSYLMRNPILRDFVFIKLDLSSKQIQNIDILQHYKYLVYLDLSTNYLTTVSVLSHLLYLQHVCVSFNRLENVLDYETPQWFLTEVHYKYNSVKTIRDLSIFWSIAILDLSHNNIKAITGLSELKYLRRLDLSFNHIQHLENLNHLNLVWLDVSYNNISSFEYSATVGLWTLLDLEYLNLNENNLTTMRVFMGCCRLRELHVRNNRLSSILEMALYLRQLRRLAVLDLRANPLCATPGYQAVACNIFPTLLCLDAEELDPLEQRALKMEPNPDVMVYACRRLLRLLYVEQLQRARVPLVPPADTTQVPMVVIVGPSFIGKGTLARRLEIEYPSRVEVARLHTTSTTPGPYINVSRDKFDDMLLDGEFLTYSEMNGNSYGLSREEAFINDGKVKLVGLDLISALMLKLRGRRPYLILASTDYTPTITKKSDDRDRSTRISADSTSLVPRSLVPERATLQVLLSGRIIIQGIINEILLDLPEEKPYSEFALDSGCSLIVDNAVHKPVHDVEETCSSITDEEKAERFNASLYSLFKESCTAEYTSTLLPQEGSRKRESTKPPLSRKSIDVSKNTSLKGGGTNICGSTKSSKSVTFTSQTEETPPPDSFDAAGLMVDAPPAKEPSGNERRPRKSLSAYLSWPQMRGSIGSQNDSDLWLTFLAGVQTAESPEPTHENSHFTGATGHSLVSMMKQHNKHKNADCISNQSTTLLRDTYEIVHLNKPGLFWDTINIDYPELAYQKMKGILKNIVNSQSTLQPMFDIDFPNLKCYPTVQNRLNKIRKQIAPQQLFY